jgi:hypothetical protein
MFIEEQSGPAWLRALGVLAAVILVGAAALLVAAIARLWGRFDALLLLGTLVVLIGVVGLAAVTGLSNRITVRVADGRIVGRLFPFRVFAVPVGDIVDLGRDEVTTVRAGGIGYRLTRTGRYLLFDDGPAVALQTRAGRTYVIRSDRPDELVAAIETAQVAAAISPPQPRG